MFRSSTAMAASLALLGATAALAAEPAPQPTTVSPAQVEAAKPARKAKLDPDKVTCRSERIVGSNRSNRLCMTNREWREKRELSREMARNSGYADLDQGEDPK